VPKRHLHLATSSLRVELGRKLATGVKSAIPAIADVGLPVKHRIEAEGCITKTDDADDRLSPETRFANVDAGWKEIDALAGMEDGQLAQAV
jgi:hypothetical protein